jgi:hypothetical protein
MRARLAVDLIASGSATVATVWCLVKRYVVRVKDVGNTLVQGHGLHPDAVGWAELAKPSVGALRAMF